MMDKKREVLEILLEERNKKGYLTLDQLLDCCEEKDLSLLESNWVSDQIVRRNIVLLDKEPDSIAVHKDDESEDLAHVDYEQIYQKVLELDQGLKPLIDSIKKIRPPQMGEFKELRDHIVEGNRFARNRLIEMYMRSVIKTALNTAQTFNLDISDTIQDGFIGLIKSVDSVGNQTSTDFQHSTNWMIYNEIIRHQDLKGAKFRIPVHLKEKSKPVIKKLDELQCFDCFSFGECQKSEEIILSMFDNNRTSLEIFRSAYYPVYSIEVLEDSLEEDLDLKSKEEIEFINENLMDDSLDRIVDKVHNESLYNIVQNELTSRERKIIIERYGLRDGQARTLEEVGSEMGVTRERIRQIESKALRKLRFKCRRRLRY